MPARNTVKQYLENGYYHVYNRGVEKRKIFLDDQDYAVFLSYLKDYLNPKPEKVLLQSLSNPNISPKEKNRILKLLRLNNFNEDISLIAYCLMPNHFHFFLKQKNSRSMNKFIQSLSTRYTMYFNRKYNRVGSLCQAVYKAKLITQENYFVYLSGYIHKQALSKENNLITQKFPSSYTEYLGKRKTSWIHPEEIISYFSNKPQTFL